jgi:hypothetical protein
LTEARKRFTDDVNMAYDFYCKGDLTRALEYVDTNVHGEIRDYRKLIFAENQIRYNYLVHSKEKFKAD